MTIFDILNDITSNKKKKLHEDPEFNNIFSSYMILRWLSMDDAFVGVVQKVEPFSSEYTKEQFYLLLCDLIPAKKVYLKYIKKPKNE